MGSFSSRPDIPQQPAPVKYVYVQTPVYTPAPSPSSPSAQTPPPASSGGTANPAAPAEPTDDEVQERARGASLLDRRRGRLSTILTGFRGLLTDTIDALPRKTLLGE